MTRNEIVDKASEHWRNSCTSIDVRSADPDADWKSLVEEALDALAAAGAIVLIPTTFEQEARLASDGKYWRNIPSPDVKNLGE